MEKEPLASFIYIHLKAWQTHGSLRAAWVQSRSIMQQSVLSSGMIDFIFFKEYFDFVNTKFDNRRTAMGRTCKFTARQRFERSSHLLRASVNQQSSLVQMPHNLDLFSSHPMRFWQKYRRKRPLSIRLAFSGAYSKRQRTRLCYPLSYLPSSSSKARSTKTHPQSHFPPCRLQTGLLQTQCFRSRMPWPSSLSPLRITCKSNSSTRPNSMAP